MLLRYVDTSSHSTLPVAISELPPFSSMISSAGFLSSKDSISHITVYTTPVSSSSAVLGGVDFILDFFCRGNTMVVETALILTYGAFTFGLTGVAAVLVATAVTVLVVGITAAIVGFLVYKFKKANKGKEA